MYGGDLSECVGTRKPLKEYVYILIFHLLGIVRCHVTP